MSEAALIHGDIHFITLINLLLWYWDDFSTHSTQTFPAGHALNAIDPSIYQRAWARKSDMQLPIQAYLAFYQALAAGAPPVVGIATAEEPDPYGGTCPKRAAVDQLAAVVAGL